MMDWIQDAVRNAPVQRNYSASSVACTRRRGDKVYMMEVSDGTSTRMFNNAIAFAIRLDECDEATAWKICRDMADYLNRWPGTIDEISLVKSSGNKTWPILGDFLMNAMRRTHLGSYRPKIKGPIRVRETGLAAAIRGIDPDNHASWKFEWQMFAARFEAQKDFELPSGLFFQAWNAAGGVYVQETPLGNGESTYDSNLSSLEDEDDEDFAKMQVMEKAMRWVQMQLDGSVAKLANVKARADEMVGELIGSYARKIESGIYRGSILAYVWSNANLSGVVPSAAVQADVSEALPTMHLNTNDKYRGRLCVARGEAEFKLSLDIVDTFVTIATSICEEAKNIELGIAARSPMLSSAQAATTWLPCCGCTRHILAELLLKNMFGRDVCGACHRREQGRVPNLEARAKLQIRSRMAGESRLAGDDAITAKRILLPALEEVSVVMAHNSAPNGFVDYYSVLGRTQSELRHMKLSVDAALPYGLAEDQYPRPHCKGNHALTIWALNACKGIQLPQFLALLAWYINKLIALIDQGVERDAESISALQRRFIIICKELRRVRIKFGWTKAARIATHTDPSTYAYDKEQMRTGRLRPADKDANLPWNNVGTVVPRLGWSKEDDTRIRNLISAIMEEFGVRLAQGSDEFKFFGHAEAMPTTWGSQSAFKWSCERYDTASSWCNWDDIVCDEPDGIYIEVIFQACIRSCTKEKTKLYDEALLTAMRARYDELLGLPLMIEPHNALRTAMGHAEHGKGMAVGWTIHPSNLADRTDESNNTLFETTTSNNLKLDFPQKFYDALINEAMKCKVWQGFAGPRGDLPDIPAAMVASIEEVKEVDALNFEDVYDEDIEIEQNEGEKQEDEE